MKPLAANRRRTEWLQFREQLGRGRSEGDGQSFELLSAFGCSNLPRNLQSKGESD